MGVFIAKHTGYEWQGGRVVNYKLTSEVDNRAILVHFPLPIRLDRRFKQRLFEEFHSLYIDYHR